MTVDERLREASDAVREARRRAEFTVAPPTRRYGPVRGSVRTVIAAFGILLILGVPAYLVGRSGPDPGAAGGSGSASSSVEGEGAGSAFNVPGEPGPEDAPRLPEDMPIPNEEDWVDLLGGVAIARMPEADGETRMWVRTDAWEPSPAQSTDIHMMWVPAGDGFVVVLVVLRPGEPRPASVTVTWDNYDMQDVALDWSSDPGIGLGLVEPPAGLTYLNIEFVEPSP